MRGEAFDQYLAVRIACAASTAPDGKHLVSVGLRGEQVVWLTSECRPGKAAAATLALGGVCCAQEVETARVNMRTRPYKQADHPLTMLARMMDERKHRQRANHRAWETAAAQQAATPLIARLLSSALARAVSAHPKLAPLDLNLDKSGNVYALHARGKGLAYEIARWQPGTAPRLKLCAVDKFQRVARDIKCHFCACAYGDMTARDYRAHSKEPAHKSNVRRALDPVLLALSPVLRRAAEQRQARDAKRLARTRAATPAPAPLPVAPLPRDGLNTREAALLAFARRSHGSFRPAEACGVYPDAPTRAKGVSWAQNSLRRLVARGLVAKATRGRYYATDGAGAL